MVIGELSIDRVASEATWRAATVRLRRQEAELLALLAHAGERPVRRERLLDELWPDDDSVRDNQLDVAVRRARRALDELPDGPRIDTVRGVGYRLRVST
ncbi:MAG: helix-turn-helix domain-containing protein [Thermoleophilia bacterium]|nr:helix-turn-helix domain-containing protein [Thermoleophilia bacterium]